MPSIGNMQQGNPGGDVGPDARANLSGLVDKLNNAKGDMNAKAFANDNQGESARMDVLKQVFQTMVDNGIDPSNLEQVQAFLDNLEKSNPEMYQAFVQAFELLLGEQEGGAEVEGEQPAAPEGALGNIPGGALGAMPGGAAPEMGARYPGLAGGSFWTGGPQAPQV